MKPHASPPTQPKRLTLEQWGDLDEDVEGELIDGVLVEEEMPTVIHETVVMWLAVLLSLWAKPRGGQVLGSEAKFAVGPRRGRKPDLSVFLKGGLPSGRDSVIHVPPLIVAEVLSPRPRDERRDRVEKVRDYPRLGAKYYWLVDPTFQTLEILELGRNGRYELALSASTGLLRRIPGCPGLKLNLGELWKEVEEAEKR